MSKNGRNRVACFAALMLGAVVTGAGCKTQGPAERAGSSIDRGIQGAKDAVNPPGTLEKAGRGVDKTLNP